MFKFIIFPFLIITTYSTLAELINSDEHYGLHTQAIPSGHDSGITGHTSTNDESTNNQIINNDYEEDSTSQEDNENQSVVQYIRVRYIAQPVYKYISATASPSPTPQNSVVQEPTIVKYIQSRPKPVKYISQPQQIIKYISQQQHQHQYQQQQQQHQQQQQQRFIKYIPQQRIVKVAPAQRVLLKYVPTYYQEQHEHLQRSVYRATPAPHSAIQQQQHNNNIPSHITHRISVPSYHTAGQQIEFTAPDYEHASIIRRSSNRENQQEQQQQKQQEQHQQQQQQQQ